jgi:hypothetical protein
LYLLLHYHFHSSLSQSRMELPLHCSPPTTRVPAAAPLPPADGERTAASRAAGAMTSAIPAFLPMPQVPAPPSSASYRCHHFLTSTEAETRTSCPPDSRPWPPRGCWRAPHRCILLLWDKQVDRTKRRRTPRGSPAPVGWPCRESPGVSGAPSRLTLRDRNYCRRSLPSRLHASYHYVLLQRPRISTRFISSLSSPLSTLQEIPFDNTIVHLPSPNCKYVGVHCHLNEILLANI